MKGAGVGQQFAENRGHHFRVHLHLCRAAFIHPLDDGRLRQRRVLLAPDEQQLLRGQRRAAGLRILEKRGGGAKLPGEPAHLLAQAREAGAALVVGHEFLEERSFEIERVQAVAHVVRVLAQKGGQTREGDFGFGIHMAINTRWVGALAVAKSGCLTDGDVS